METLHFCEKCKKPILPCNEQKKDKKYYHKKCLNTDSSQNEKEDKGKDFIKERRLTMNLKSKYSKDYLGKTLMTEVVRPYYQFKYTLERSKYLELVPQVAFYFQDLDENKAKEFVKNGGMEKLKLELNKLLGDDFSITFENIVYGSFLGKFYVFFKKIKSGGKKAIKKLKDIFTHKKKETKKIQEAVEAIQSHSFQCFENLKPSDVKFVNQKKLENTQAYQAEIKDFLESQNTINYDAKSNWSLETNISENNFEEKEFNENEFNRIFENIKNLAENKEIELNEEIENIKSNESFNKSLLNYLESAFKESVFEYSITGIVVNNKEGQKNEYEERKKNCPNCETKILFHATKILFSSKILTTNFLLSRDNYFGLGVYFGDQFDYIKFYYNPEKTYQTITKLNESFSIVVSEVYYDKTKFKQIYDYSKYIQLNTTPNEQIINQNKSKTVEDNGIHYVEVDSLSCHVINQDRKVLHMDGSIEDLPKTRLIAREYCVTNRDQIFPIYGINLQRVDFCIIWRDTNFDSFVWKESLNKNKEVIKSMTGYRLYTESNSKDALKLIYRKRFNKIIIITNVGKNLEGKKYVDKVRKILEFNVAALFFTDDMNHLDWIKDYPNGLFCMDDYTIKKYIFNYGLDGYNDIRNNVRDFYGVELQKPQNAFDYPLFERYKDTTDILGLLELDEYSDFEGI